MKIILFPRNGYAHDDGRNLVYANSLLATLNGRAGIRAANPTTANSIHLSELEFESSTATETVRSHRDYEMPDTA